MINLADRAAEDIAARLHCVPPYVLVEIQTPHDRRLSRIDRAAFIRALCPARPVDELEIFRLRERNRARFFLAFDVWRLEAEERRFSHFWGRHIRVGLELSNAFVDRREF